MTGYLELHGADTYYINSKYIHGADTYYINAKYIAGFYKSEHHNGKTLINMSSGASYVVNESVEEIKAMIDKI